MAETQRVEASAQALVRHAVYTQLGSASFPAAAVALWQSRSWRLHLLDTTAPQGRHMRALMACSWAVVEEQLVADDDEHQPAKRTNRTAGG